MANRAYLLNTPILTSDPFLLRENLSKPGNDYLEVAEASYRLLVPWLCCFRAGDLKPVAVPTEDMDGNLSTLTIGLPSTTVEQAIRNLEESLPVFVRITGERQLAHRFWSRAMATLKALPLPYLALDPTEVLLMLDPEGSAEDLRTALSGNPEALAYIKDFANIEDGALPYPPDVLMSVPGPHHDNARIETAVALDDGSGGAFWHRSEGSTTPADAGFAVPADRSVRSLTNVLDYVSALLKVRGEGLHAVYGFMELEPSRPERLKLLISASTDAQRDRLLADARLRSELNGFIAGELRALCSEYGFTWQGCVIESNENLKRRFGQDINRWLELPATASA